MTNIRRHRNRHGACSLIRSFVLGYSLGIWVFGCLGISSFDSERSISRSVEVFWGIYDLDTARSVWSATSASGSGTSASRLSRRRRTDVRGTPSTRDAPDSEPVRCTAINVSSALRSMASSCNAHNTRTTSAMIRPIAFPRTSTPHRDLRRPGVRAGPPPPRTLVHLRGPKEEIHRAKSAS